jgi:hypothetical protein
VLEIYAEFDSLKQSQVALCAYPTNLRIIQAKDKKRKSVKARTELLRLFLTGNLQAL